MPRVHTRMGTCAPTPRGRRVPSNVPIDGCDEQAPPGSEALSNEVFGFDLRWTSASIVSIMPLHLSPSIIRDGESNGIWAGLSPSATGRLTADHRVVTHPTPQPR